MFRKFNKRSIGIGIGAVGLAILGVVAALAFFTANGTGSGNATVGSDSGVTIENVSVSGSLYPGGTSPVSFDVKNVSSNSSVKVANVVLDSISTPVGCTNGDFSFAPATVALSTELAPGATAPGTGTLSMADATTNQDSCKGKSLSLNLKVDNSSIGGS